MSYSCICVICGDRYNGGPQEEEFLSDPSYQYDPTDFQCKPCREEIDKEVEEAREEEIIQYLMENEFLERMVQEHETGEGY